MNSGVYKRKERNKVLIMTKKNVFNQLRCIFFSKRENLSDWMNRVDNTCNVINVHIYNETGPERNERVVNVLNKAFACLI